MLYYAQAIANSNTSVYLVTCSSSAITKENFTEVFDNVFILKNNTITQSFSGTYRFVKNLYTFSKNAASERVFLFYPSPLVYLEVLALYYLKFLKKCNVYYELNEVRKHSSTFHKKLSIKRLKYSVKKLIYKSVFTSLESCLSFYDGLICISTAIQDYGKKYNSKTIRIPILTNPYLEKEYSNTIYHKKDSFNIGFSGSIQPDKENLLNFFKVLGKLKSDNIDFTLNLCGILKKQHEELLLNRVATELNIKSNIKFYGNLNAKELSTFLSQQQLLIIPRGFTLQNNYGFSTKLSDYLDHGKPILVTNVSDNKLFIKDGENGFIVPTDDNEKMYQKLKHIVTNYKDIHEIIEENANETSKISFYYKNFSNEFHNFFFNKNQSITSN